MSIWELGLLRTPAVQDMAQSQPGITVLLGWKEVIIHVSVPGSHLKLMNGFAKIGHFPFINMVWALSLPMGVQAQLGHAFKLSSSLGNNRFHFVMRSSAHPTTPEAGSSVQGGKQM